jgi:hypothetical protein
MLDGQTDKSKRTEFVCPSSTCPLSAYSERCVLDGQTDKSKRREFVCPSSTRPLSASLHSKKKNAVTTDSAGRGREEHNHHVHGIHDIRLRRHCDINKRYPMRLRRVSSRNQLPIAHHHLVFGKSPDVKENHPPRRRFQQLGFGQCQRLVSQDSRIRMSLSSTVIMDLADIGLWFMSISCLYSFIYSR